MEIEFYVDPTTESLAIKQNEKVILSLSKEEAILFLKNANEVQNNFGYLFAPPKNQIMLKDLIEEQTRNQAHQWGNIVSINFSGEKMLRIGHVNFHAEFVFENGNSCLVPNEVSENFSEGYLWEGTLSNFDLKKCLDSDLRNYLMNNPDVSICFDGVNITAEVLYYNEKSYVIFDESYDT